MLIVLTGGSPAPDARTDPPAKGKAPASSPGVVPASKPPVKSEVAKRTVPLRQKLNEWITVEKGVDPGTPLRDTLNFLGERYDLTILVDAPAFKEAGNEAVEDQPVRLPPLAGVRLDTVLQQIAAQVHGVYLLKGDHIEITTALRAALEVWGPAMNSETEQPGRKRPALPLVHTAFTRRTLENALRELADLTGYSVVLDRLRTGEQPKTPVTATLDNVPLDSAVRLLASQADLKTVLLDNVLFVTTREHAQALQQGQPLSGEAEGNTPGEMLGWRLHQPVELSLEEVPLDEALRHLSRETGAQILLSNQVGRAGQSAISLHLKDVSLETAVRLAAEMVGLKPVLVGNVLFVTTEAHATKLRAEQEHSLTNTGAIVTAGGLGALGGGGLGGALGLMGGSWPNVGPAKVISLPAPAGTEAKPDKSAKPTTAKPRASEPAPRLPSRTVTLGRKLAELVTLKQGIEPNTPLKDALEHLAKAYNLTPVLIDSESFKQAGVESPEEAPVRLPRVSGVRLGTVLQQLVAQVQGAYLVRGDHIEITSAPSWQTEVWGRFTEEEPNRRRRFLPLVHAAFEQRPLEDAIRELADTTGFNVVLDTRHAGESGKMPVTALLNNVPLDTAVRLLADQADLQAVLLDNVLQLTTQDRARALGAEQDRANQKGIEFPASFAQPGPQG
jgi:hypothetical protein